MSALTDQNDRLKRLNRASADVRAAQDAFRAVFKCGTRVEFDRGDMVLCCGTVVSVTRDAALVEPDEAIDEQCRLTECCDGQILVPWAWLFTSEAAAEMHKVRDPLIG